MYRIGRLSVTLHLSQFYYRLSVRCLSVKMGSLPAERRLKVDSVCIIGAGPSGLAAAK